jgi:membrane-associated phospholipid phosphatase
MDDIKIKAPPQPGSPQQARRWLPLGALGTSALIGAIFCVLLTLGFAWLAKGVFSDRFVAIDNGVITWLHNYWGPASNNFMLFFTTIGEVWVLGPLIAVAAFALTRSRRWIDAGGLVLAGLGAGLLNLVLKDIFERARPNLFPGPIHLTTYSFPSGHAMGSIAVYGMLAFVSARLTNHRLLRYAIVLVAMVIVFFIGLSRVFFGVHYPTDVIGGYLAGAIWLAISILTVLAGEDQAKRRQALEHYASMHPEPPRTTKTHE